MTEQNIARSRAALARQAFKENKPAEGPATKPAVDDEDLTRRAFAAYYRSLAREGAVTVQPSSNSGVVEHDGKLYVVLHNVNGILAVYRVRTSGALKALRRWPAAIDAWR